MAHSDGIQPSPHRPRLYLSVYLAKQPPKRTPANLCSSATDLWSAMRDRAWPYDVGDDPSFFMADRLRAPVTWGVCRPDLRKRVRPGDIVVFFAGDFGTDGSISYRMSAALTVERKLTYEQIFQDRSHASFGEYLNLLARPNGEGWERFEPSLPESKWHDDWLWRLAPRGFQRADCVAAGSDQKPGSAFQVAGRIMPTASNYVVFATDVFGALVADDPPEVAHWDGEDDRETWWQDHRSRRIRSLTLGLMHNQDRMLRARNSRLLRNAHPYASGTLDRPAGEWFSQLRKVVGGA